MVLAHELGHSLFLQHGDGKDNDGNGRFDDYCDHPEFVRFDSIEPLEQRTIMDVAPNAQFARVIPLQRELARAAAAVTPGAIGGPP